MRTFIAVDFPTDVRSTIAQVQQRAQAHLRRQCAPDCLRWTPIQNSHLTLFFLGDTTDAQAATLATNLAAIGARHAPFRLDIDGVGCFRDFTQPRVVWLGMGGALDNLHALQSHVTTVAQQAGFVAEKRPYSPHITLARARRNTGRADLWQVGRLLRAFADEMAQQPPIPVATFPVDHLVHMQSQRRGGGVVYTPLGHIPLGK